MIILFWCLLFLLPFVVKFLFIIVILRIIQILVVSVCIICRSIATAVDTAIGINHAAVIFEISLTVIGVIVIHSMIMTVISSAVVVIVVLDTFIFSYKTTLCSYKTTFFPNAFVYNFAIDTFRSLAMKETVSKLSAIDSGIISFQQCISI